MYPDSYIVTLVGAVALPSRSRAVISDLAVVLYHPFVEVELKEVSVFAGIRESAVLVSLQRFQLWPIYPRHLLVGPKRKGHPELVLVVMRGVEEPCSVVTGMWLHGAQMVDREIPAVDMVREIMEFDFFHLSRAGMTFFLERKHPLRALLLYPRTFPVH